MNWIQLAFIVFAFELFYARLLNFALCKVC
jgi:hypothetical protein